MPWYWIVICILFILLVMITDGGFRLVSKRDAEIQAKNQEIENLKRQLGLK
jgi:hypothetical protein